jgi:hypothetical protein
MSLREPITLESLGVALNRATSLRLVPRDVVLAYHHWRWVAHLPDQRIAFVTDTVDARQRMRYLLRVLTCCLSPRRRAWARSRRGRSSLVGVRWYVAYPLN